MFYKSSPNVNKINGIEIGMLKSLLFRYITKKFSIYLHSELGIKYFFLYLNTKYMLKMYLNTIY